MFGSLPSMQETHMKLLALGFGLVSLCCCSHVEREDQRTEDICVFLQLRPFQNIFKNNDKKEISKWPSTVKSFLITAPQEPSLGCGHWHGFIGPRSAQNCCVPASPLVSTPPHPSPGVPSCLRAPAGLHLSFHLSLTSTRPRLRGEWRVRLKK